VNIFEAANILVDEMTRVSNLLVSVNSSVNFIIYCIFGDKFKRLFLRYFCCAGYLRTPSGRGSPVDPHDNSLVSANFGMGTNWTSTEQRTSFSACGRNSFGPGSDCRVFRLEVYRRSQQNRLEAFVLEGTSQYAN